LIECDKSPSRLSRQLACVHLHTVITQVFFLATLAPRTWDMGTAVPALFLTISNPWTGKT